MHFFSKSCGSTSSRMVELPKSCGWTCTTIYTLRTPTYFSRKPPSEPRSIDTCARESDEMPGSRASFSM